MKLARVRTIDDRELVGSVHDDEVAVLDAVDVVAAATAPPTGERLLLADVRLLAPIARPPKFLAIGFNYADHTAEFDAAPPAFPLVFNKQSTCVIGPGDGIEVPPESAMVDYEGELGVVIGQRCRRVVEADALDVIAGYLIVNDVSVRDWQGRSPTMTLGKSWDTHGPIGPWLTTPDEVPDPQALRLRTIVSGETLQDASTADMLTTVAQQIAVLSTVMTLEPGDVIATGTPAGVGLARTPPRWVVPGDVVRVEIDGLGALENPVVAG